MKGQNKNNTNMGQGAEMKQVLITEFASIQLHELIHSIMTP